MQFSELCKVLLLLVAVIHACIGQNADFTQLCERKLVALQANDPSLQDDSRWKCGAEYSATTPAAQPINIPLAECLANEPGWQISQVKILSQWIGPLVGFLLPSLVFTLVIPRRHRVPRQEEWFDRHICLSICWLVVAFLGVVLDVLVWIIFCFSVVGPIIVGAVDESLKDWLILRSVESTMKQASFIGEAVDRRQVSYAIAITLLAPFEPGAGGLSTKVRHQISDVADAADTREKLEQLYAHQTPFGVQVGAPVVFYLGAYIYAIFDATSRLGDNDTAHAISFGLWYGVLVIAAICSCAVLGIENVKIIKSIFEPHGRHSKPLYKISCLWDRARCHREWTHVGPNEGVSEEIKQISESRWVRFFACFTTVGLISVICALACAISYLTPTIGFGCRSVTVLLYGLSQNTLVGIWFYLSEHKKKKKKRSCCLSFFDGLVYVLITLCLIASIFATVAGTIMQLLGVYRNCVCKAGLAYWVHNAGGFVELATDTLSQRESGTIWTALGITGISFIGFVSVVGWGYYMRMKAKCWKLIEKI